MAQPLSDPERELALIYAKPEARPHVRVLWALDEKFASIVAGTSEPTIGEMRLLWWRDALERISSETPAEPLLVNISETLQETGADGAQWGAMAEGWYALLQEPIGETELERFAEERGARLFRLSAELLERDPPAGIEAAGQGWALVDLAQRVTDVPLVEDAMRLALRSFETMDRTAWVRALRPLGALAVLARRDARASQRTVRKGAPLRVARMAWHRLTGR